MFLYEFRGVITSHCGPIDRRFCSEGEGVATQSDLFAAAVQERDEKCNLIEYSKLF